MKKLLVTLLFILMIPLALSVSERNISFTNGLNIENLTFTESGSIERILQFDRFINVTSGYIDFKSYLTNNTGYCYQEFANLPECYYISNGLYSYSTNWTSTIYATDGIWSDIDGSSCSCIGSCRNADLYINYTIPTLTGLTKWQVKHGKLSAKVLNNYTVPNSCLTTDTLQLKVHSECDGTVGITGYCYNNGGATWDILFSNIGVSTTVLYEEAVFWDINNSITNLNLTIGDNSNYTIGKFDTLNLSITNYLTALLPECTCTGCSINSNLCSIPFDFYSDTAGVLQYSNLDIDYTFNQYDINVTIYDSVTLNVLNGVNITGQYIGSESQEEKTTTNGLFNFKVNITTVSEDVSLILFQTTGTDYSLVAKEFTFYQGQPQNISIYMTNTSSTTTNKEVTFIVKDEDRVLLEGAVIKIYKRDPATNQFLELTDLTTNPDGEASTVLTLNTVFYRFIVIYNGKQVYISSAPYPISASDDTITLNCIIGEAYSDYYIKFQGFTGTFEFTKTTNESGYYTITYTSDTSVTACLNSSYITNTVTFQNGETCLTGTSGLLTSNTITVTKFSDVYGYLSLDFGDAQGKQTVRSLHNYLGLSGSSSDTGRLFVVFGLIILSSVAFVYVPIVGLIVFAIGILIVSFTKFTLIEPVYAMFIVGLTVFVIFVLTKNEKK